MQLVKQLMVSDTSLNCVYHLHFFTLLDQDYEYGIHTVTFPARTTIIYLSISITNDNIVEGDENFALTIDRSSLPNDIFIDDNYGATVTIADDDCMFIILFHFIYVTILLL